MTTRTEVRRSVNAAAREYEQCLLLLDAMKRGRLRRHAGLSLTDFQPTLATALSKLSSLYLQLAAEKERRVRAKDDLSRPWFLRRMRFLSSQQEILCRAIHIGRYIGDGFAWFFYQNNRRFLLEHLKEPAQLLFPQGVGGFAELEMVKKVPVTHGQFVLYHGITSILRLGDLSLIDLKRLTVTTVGEIKAGKPADGKLAISMLFATSPVDGTSLRETDVSPDARQHRFAAASPAARERLARQLQRIGKAHEELQSQIDTKLSYEMEDRISAFERFLKGTSPRKCSFKVLGKSLLLISVRQSRLSLYDRLRISDESWKAKLSGIEKEVLPLLVPSRRDNSLFINGWPFQEDGRPSHRPGMTHPLWWPLSSSILRQLVLQKAVVFTAFNPAHLFAALEAAGFETKTESLAQLSVSKKLENKLFKLEGVSHYLQMVQEYFFSEADIIAMLHELEDHVRRADPSEPTRIDLYFEQRFSRQPARGVLRPAHHAKSP